MRCLAPSFSRWWGRSDRGVPEVELFGRELFDSEPVIFDLAAIGARSVEV
jgi:hypothetical protein